MTTPATTSPPAPAPELDLTDTVDKLLGDIEAAGAAMERSLSDTPPHPELVAQQAATPTLAPPTPPAAAAPAPADPVEAAPQASSPASPLAHVEPPSDPQRTIEQVDRLLHDAAAKLDQDQAPSPDSIKSLDEHISKLTDQMLGEPASPSPATPAAETGAPPAAPQSTAPQTPAPPPAAPAAPVAAKPEPAKPAAPAPPSAPPPAAPAPSTPTVEHVPGKQATPATPPNAEHAPSPAAEPQPTSEPLAAKVRRWLAPLNTLALRGCAAACKPLESHGVHADRALGIVAIVTAACATLTWGIVLFRPAPHSEANIEAYDFEHGTPPPVVHAASESEVSEHGATAEGEKSEGGHEAKPPPKKDAKKDAKKASTKPAKKDPKKDPKKSAKKPSSEGGGH